jgi:hypothetical protein
MTIPSLRITLGGMLAMLCIYGLVSLPGMEAAWRLTPTGIGVLVVWALIACAALPLSRAKPPRLAVSLAIIAVIAMRVMLAIVSSGHESPGDPHSYLVLAHSLLAGQGLVIYEPWFQANYRALFPPAYPLLLAGWGAVFGLKTASLLALNTLTDLGAAWLMIRIGARLGRVIVPIDRSSVPAKAGAQDGSVPLGPGLLLSQEHEGNRGRDAGRGAAFLYLIWPSALFSAPLAQKESLAILLVLALAWAWLRLIELGRRDRVAVVVLGIAAALLALTQPGWAMLAALFGLMFMRRAGIGRIVSAGLPAAALAVVVMLPWWVRNWLVFHTFVPLTTAGGAGLWIGNHPGASGNWEPPLPELRGLSEMVYGPRAAAIAKDWIVHHPLDFAKLSLQKFLHACGVAVFGLTRLKAMGPPLGPDVEATLFPFSYFPHLVMLGGGAVAAGLSRNRTLLLLIAACGLQLILFGVWFEFGERHREFVTPFLLLLITMEFAPKRS